MEIQEHKTKVFAKCKRELPLTAFHKKSSSKDGLQAHCKECAAKYNRNIYLREPLQSTKYRNPDLSKFTPWQLIEELRFRGYHGKLTYTNEIEL